MVVEARPNVRWSLDFVHDQMASGQRFRVLSVIDDMTKQCLAAIPDTSISGRRVARELTALVQRHGKPRLIVSDNGTEFTSLFRDLDHARSALVRWVVDYSDHRPHSALGYLTPRAFASTFTATDDRLRNPDQRRRSPVAHPAHQRQTHPRTLASAR